MKKMLDLNKLCRLCMKQFDNAADIIDCLKQQQLIPIIRLLYAVQVATPLRDYDCGITFNFNRQQQVEHIS